MAHRILSIVGTLALVVGTTACTTAGPFVTQISAAGPGKLTVEKCSVEFNSFLGVIQMKDCNRHQVSAPVPAHYHPEQRATR